MIDELEARMGLKRTAVIEVAIRQLHRKEIEEAKPQKKPKRPT